MTTIRSAALLTLLTAAALQAQGTRADYERAEQFLGSNSRLLLAGATVAPVWLPNSDRFWYRNNTGSGSEFVSYDPATQSKRPAFDHARLAAALSIANDTAYEPNKLPFQTFEFVTNAGSIKFEVDSMRSFTCDLTRYSCTKSGKPERKPLSEVRSPDGKQIAFVRNWNLFVRDIAGGQEKQLSTNGVVDYGYGTPIGCCDQVTSVRQKREKRPVIVWSGDSKKIGTYRADERNVKPLYLLETATGRPILHTYRYALPGDSVVPRLDVHVFDVASGQHVTSSRGPQDAVNTSCCWLQTDTLWKRWAVGKWNRRVLLHARPARLQEVRADRRQHAHG